MKSKIKYCFFISLLFVFYDLQAQNQQETAYFYKTAIELFKNTGNDKVEYFYAENIPKNHLTQITSLKFIDVRDKKNKKLIKKSIDIYYLEPIFIDGRDMIVIIRSYKVYYKKRTYNFIYKGGGKIIFTYNCNNNKWEIKQTEFFSL